jgi:hypothetical protein
MKGNAMIPDTPGTQRNVFLLSFVGDEGASAGASSSVHVANEGKRLRGLLKTQNGA